MQARPADGAAGCKRCDVLADTRARVRRAPPRDLANDDLITRCTLPLCVRTSGRRNSHVDGHPSCCCFLYNTY